jgi:tryptophan synthase beta chain
MTTVEDLAGHVGPYRGRCVPEALIGALEELEAARIKAQTDPTYIAE